MEDYKRLNELKYKLENGLLIELPCKVGDTVYIPVADCRNCPYLEHNYYKRGKHKGQWTGYDRCNKTGETDGHVNWINRRPIKCKGGEYRIVEEKFDLSDYFCDCFYYNCYYKDINKTWFIDKSKAEEKLRELTNTKVEQNENNND